MHADCFAGVEFKTIVGDPILTLFTHGCISLCACRRDFAILIILRLHKELVQVIGLQLLGPEEALLGLGIATMVASLQESR